MNLFNKKNLAISKAARQKVLWLHPTALTAFMKSLRWVIVDNHLPEDAEFHHVFWSPERQVWGCVITSMDFEPLYVGQQIPELPPIKYKFFDPAIHGQLPPDQKPPSNATPKFNEGGA